MIWDMKFCLDIIMIISTVKKIFQYSEENRKGIDKVQHLCSVFYIICMWTCGLSAYL